MRPSIGWPSSSSSWARRRSRSRFQKTSWAGTDDNGGEGSVGKRGPRELWFISGPGGAVVEALSLARSTWCYHRSEKRSYEAKYAHLRRPLEQIARAHPEYGYRRTTTELGEQIEEVINHKIVQQLHRLWDLPLMRTSKRPRPSGVRKLIVEAGERVNLVRSLERIGPFEVAYTDFTELAFGGGTVHFIPILDHETKVVLGWAVAEGATTTLALRAWRKTKSMLGRLGLLTRGLIVHHDQDPVFTSYRWVDQLLRHDEARVSYALRGAKDNPEMESFFGRFKTENRSLFLDARSAEELIKVVGKRIRYYNWERRHSSLGNQAPLRYAKSLRKEK